MADRGITFACPACRRLLRAAERYAAQVVRCPVCRAAAVVPGPPPGPAPVSPDDPTTPLRPRPERPPA